jgi:hypothetical protein
MHLTAGPSGVRFVGWATTGDAEGEISERRIVVRFSISQTTSRKLRRRNRRRPSGRLGGRFVLTGTTRLGSCLIVWASASLKLGRADQPRAELLPLSRGAFFVGARQDAQGASPAAKVDATAAEAIKRASCRRSRVTMRRQAHCGRA